MRAAAVKQEKEFQRMSHIRQAKAVVREADFSMPKMTAATLQLENDLAIYLMGRGAGGFGVLKVRGAPGTGIIVATDGIGRVWKVEVSQVDGPEA